MLMNNSITITIQRPIDLAVFLDANNNVLGYQLGPETLIALAIQSPFPETPPDGTKTVINVQLYGHVKYILHMEDRHGELLTYSTSQIELQKTVQDKLKDCDDKMCVVYNPLDPSNDMDCRNCSYQTYCL
jgi:hypothetical protein